MQDARQDRAVGFVAELVASPLRLRIKRRRTGRDGMKVALTTPRMPLVSTSRRF